MKKNVRKIVSAVGVVSLLGLCLLPLLQWVRPGDDSQDQDATHGVLITLTPPHDYGMKVQRFGSANQGIRLWQLEKTTNGYVVSAKVTLQAESPLMRLPQFPTVGALSSLLAGYQTRSISIASPSVNPSRVGPQQPPQIVSHGGRKATVNGIAFSGFQMEEARSDAFFVIHRAHFAVRGRHYDTDAVFHFADKHPDPAKVKIAAAEWRKILSSIR